MWKGFEEALGLYAFTTCEVWVERGFGDTCAATIATDLRTAGVDVVRRQDDLRDAGALPPSLGDPAFHGSHQAALVRKAPDFYGPLFPGVDGDHDYVWPVRHERSTDT